MKARAAGAPTLPAASVARTSKTRAPGGCDGVVYGDAQAANVPGDAARPTRQANDAPGSLAANVNAGVASLVEPLGPPVIETAGATVSTVNVLVAAGPVLYAGSVARTSKRNVPSGSGGAVNGGPQAANGVTPAIGHSNVEPGSEAAKREDRRRVARRRGRAARQRHGGRDAVVAGERRGEVRQRADVARAAAALRGPRRDEPGAHVARARRHADLGLEHARVQRGGGRDDRRGARRAVEVVGVARVDPAVEEVAVAARDDALAPALKVDAAAVRRERRAGC